MFNFAGMLIEDVNELFPVSSMFKQYWPYRALRAAYQRNMD